MSLCRENILYGLDEDAKVSEEEFQRIIKEAHVSEFVKTLPDGLNTLVGQRGMMLSGGQKQRVAIARALIKVIKGIVRQPTALNSHFTYPMHRIPQS